MVAWPRTATLCLLAALVASASAQTIFGARSPEPAPAPSPASAPSPAPGPASAPAGAGPESPSPPSSPGSWVTPTDSKVLWKHSSCSTGSGKKLDCYAANASNLASACGANKAAGNMIGFIDSWYSPKADCSTFLDTTADLMGWVDSTDACACKCVSDPKCQAFTFQPEFSKSKRDHNCFLFYVAPNKLALCPSLYGGVSAEFDT